MKIAIVDDSMSVRMMIAISLDELEVKEEEICEFCTADEALENFLTNQYDLIFCDLHMPGMDSFALVKEIRKKITHLKNAKVIMVTGEENIAYQEKFKNLGVHQFIKKPIHPPAFKHHVKPVIEKIKRNSCDI